MHWESSVCNMRYHMDGYELSNTPIRRHQRNLYASAQLAQQVTVQGGQHVAEPAIMRNLPWVPIGHRGDGQSMFGIGESDTRLGASVTERSLGRSATETIRDRIRPVLVRVDDDPQPKVDRVLEGLIELPDSMP